MSLSWFQSTLVGTTWQGPSATSGPVAAVVGPRGPGGILGIYAPDALPPVTAPSLVAVQVGAEVQIWIVSP